MKLSGISIRYGKEMFVVFTYVKQTVLPRNRKVTKGQCIYSQKMKQKKKWIKAISNTNLRVC